MAYHVETTLLLIVQLLELETFYIAEFGWMTPFLVVFLQVSCTSTTTTRWQIMQMHKLVRRHAMASFSKKFYLDTSLSLLRQRLVVSFEFGGQGSLNEDCNHSVFVVLAGANTTSKFSVQHSHNTSFGRTALPQSTPTLGATPFLIFAFRAISGRLKDMFVEDVQKRYRYHPK